MMSHRRTIRWNAISVIWSCSVVSDGHSFCTRRGGGIQEYLQESEPEEEEPEAMMMMGTLCGGVLSSGCPTASHTGEENEIHKKWFTKQLLLCWAPLSNTHVSGPLEILSSSFITDHLKTREADLPGLEETPRPTERRQSLLFPSAFTHKSEAMLDCLRM